MYSTPNFFDYFTRIAGKNSDHVLLDGNLKKGTWKTMPNGIHVFLVDGKIEAGPKSTMGKAPDELDWDVVHKEEAKHAAPEPVSPEVVEKYKPYIWQAATIKNKDLRRAEIDKTFTKMAAEDNFHCIFLNTQGKASPALQELTDAFMDYGSFPIHSSEDDQLIYYNDRVALLYELAHAVPEHARKDIKGQIDFVKEQIDLLKSGGETKDQYDYRVNVHQQEDIANAVPPSRELALTRNQPPMAHRTKTRPNGHPGKPGPGGRNQPASPPNAHPGKPGPGGQNTTVPTTTPNGHPGRPGPGGQNVPPPTNTPAPNPRPQSPKTPVSQTRKPRAKTRQHLTIESAIKGLFTYIVTLAAQYITKGLKKSEHTENKMLLKVTKQILSNTNVNERDNFYDVFLKTFGTP